MSSSQVAVRSGSVLRMAAAMAAAAMLCQSEVSFAHIVIGDDRAFVDSFKAISFWVPESCSGSPTTALSIEIPPNIKVAKPQSKPGWTVQLIKEPPPRAKAGEAQVIESSVTRVVWYGGQIPDDQFDQFTLLIQTPSEAGPVYFLAVQRCGASEVRWFETPNEKNATTGMSMPAPVLKVVHVDVRPDSRRH